MNLHAIVSGAIAAVNPMIVVGIQRSSGYTKDSSFRQVPQYSASVPTSAQVQPLTYKELEQLDGLNLQGTRKSIYINGAVAGAVRAAEVGGDLVTMPDGSVWLVVLIFEQWPDWCKAAITLQNGS